MTREEALRFGDGHRLIGILTRPAEGGDASLGVIVLNSGIIHRVGPNRMQVELARGIADGAGLPVLRFDLAGIGDSGRPRSTVLADSVRDDIADSIDLMCSRCGADAVVLVGLCSGADNAYLAALRDPRVAGVVLMDPTTFRTWGFHVRDVWRRVASPGWWVRLASREAAALRMGPAAVRRLRKGRPTREAAPRRPAFYGMMTATRSEVRLGLEKLVGRGVRLLYVFTGGRKASYNYAGQFRDAFRGLDFRGLLDVAYVPGADHTFSRVRDRTELFATILRWLARIEGPPSGGHGAGTSSHPGPLTSSHTAPERAPGPPPSPAPALE